MRRSPRSFLFALLSLAPVLSAQERPHLRVLPGALPPGVARSTIEPVVERITYDVTTGKLRDRRSVPPESLAAGSTAIGTACFSNSDLGACGMQDHSPWTIANLPGDELLDWGVKSCNGSNLVQSLTIAYRTTELDVADGGPGATLTFGLYQGTLGWNRVGTEVFRRTFTGLPGQRLPVWGSTHAAPFVFLTIDFGTQPLLLRDGPIGWGYQLFDNEVGSTIATGALLVRAPNPATGVIDALDTFSPGPASTGTYIGTFNFGTTCNFPPDCCPKASTWLQLVEAPASAAVWNGSGANPEVFSEQLPARIGQGWVTQFDLSAHPGTTSTLIFFSCATLARPRVLRAGEILIDPQQWFPPILMGGTVQVLPIPNSTALAGLRFYAQGALQRPSGLLFTNALDVTVGL